MKKISKHSLKMKLRKHRKETQAANETTALFLGPKLLGELRILMRLASPAQDRGAHSAKESVLKSF
jgi:hypothetical protein